MEFQIKTEDQEKARWPITYIHTYMKFIMRCIVEDGSNQRRGLLLSGGV